MAALDIDGGFHIPAERFLLLGLFPRRRIRDIDPGRVASDERLREGNELRTTSGRLVKRVDHGGRRGLSIEPDGGGLNSSNTHGRTVPRSAAQRPPSGLRTERLSASTP